MNTETFHSRFRPLWDSAVGRYRAGKRGAGNLFTPDETAQLASLGMTAQELYDFAEDQVNYGEPSYETAASISEVRFAYFREKLGGKPTGKVGTMESLPPKSEEVDGIRWLPRLMAKSRLKLRGEMPSDLVYGCGGDRGFFQEHGIAAEEFLKAVWRFEDDPAGLRAWFHGTRRSQR